MPFVIKAAKGAQRDGISKVVMDYKNEMCSMIDNINMVDVFRSIDVDMPDNYISNLQVTQIQRLMKVKGELQGASPDIREIQLTLKRFILDLDVKEAYEFSILNPFLINEEELHKLMSNLDQNTEEELFNQKSHEQLNLHHNQFASSSDEEMEPI